MTDIQRKHTIEVIILVMLLIIGGLLVSRIPAQTVKPALPIGSSTATGALSATQTREALQSPIIKPVVKPALPIEIENVPLQSGTSVLAISPSTVVGIDFQPYQPSFEDWLTRYTVKAKYAPKGCEWRRVKPDYFGPGKAAFVCIIPMHKK